MRINENSYVARMNGTCHTVEATQWSKSMKSHTLPYLAMQNNNETEAFLDAQYVSAPEASWQLFQFEPTATARLPPAPLLSLHEANHKILTPQLFHPKAMDEQRGKAKQTIKCVENGLGHTRADGIKLMGKTSG
ncbi:hypothetical protein PSTT_04902 [Puccinia striiformis]|uniref:Uncharacterized protein n=1 Tax=Puccinia striiformis TaxID=27350 RepID=A0A2S4VQR3_9BASI|nr:hypothetical protein PSTT_04902 [Puccinia striiformis]